MSFIAEIQPINASGSLTALNQEVLLTLNGHANTTFQLTGTWVGTVSFEASNNNTDWSSIFTLDAGENIITTSVTTNDIYRCTTAGFKYVRARCSAFTSGTIVVTAYATENTSGVFLNFPLPPGTNKIGEIAIGATTFTQSTGNSSTAQLTAGSTFTGTLENLITGISLLVSLRVDQPVTINILQYIDAGGTQLVGTSTFTRLANQPFNEAIQINGNYVRVTVKNNGVASTTNLVLDSWFGNMPPFPTAVTNEGNFKVAIAQNSARNRVGQYGYSSFRTLGTAATPQNLFTIENPNGSTKKLAIKKLKVLVDSTAALTSVSPSIKLSRPAALPTGGTQLTAVKWDTSMPNTVAVVRGGNASDGGAATAITVTAGTAVLCTRYVDRLHTAVGYIAHQDLDLLEEFGQEEPLILNGNESILVQVVLANAATTHFVVNAIVEEYI